jgi:hypothetical protein
VLPPVDLYHTRLENVAANWRKGKRVGHGPGVGFGNVWYVMQIVMFDKCLTKLLLGIAELLVFHPVDTVAKRLMSNKSSTASISSIIFKDKAGAPFAQRFISLFPGLGYAAGYKVAQRVYKFGGQPYFHDLIFKHYRSTFTSIFGERKGKLMMQASAGRCVEPIYLNLYTVGVQAHRRMYPRTIRHVA